MDWQIRSPLQSDSHAQFTENRLVTNVVIVSIGRISIKGIGDVDWPIMFGQWFRDYIREHSAYGAECGIGLLSHLRDADGPSRSLSVTESIRPGAGAPAGWLISRNLQWATQIISDTLYLFSV